LEGVSTNDYRTMPTLLLHISGMTCGHCEKAVKTAIKSVDAAAQVVIDRVAGTASIESDQAKQAFVDAIVEEGYSTT
jgi:copper chaperone